MRDYIVTVDESEDELMHYGVVGMHWHHRRAASYAAKGNMKKAQQHLDKNKANNLKKGGVYYKRLEKVSSKDIDKARRRGVAGKAALAVGAGALVGYGGVKLAKNAAANKAMRNRYMSPADRMRNSSVQPGVVMDNLRNNMGNNSRTTVNRSQTPKPNNSRTTVNRSQTPKPNNIRRTVNNQNTRSGVDELQKVLREYQELSNRAGADLERRRNNIKRTTSNRR